MNPLLLTDVYKLSHMLQYPPDTTEVYSYLEARKPGFDVVFFGLQYILMEYLTCGIIEDLDASNFIYYYEKILGPCPESIQEKVHALGDLGYWPVEIKAVLEGSLVKSQNILMSIRNTHPDFYWCVGFLESLLLKVWNPCTVATASLKYRRLVEKYAEETCDDLSHIPFAVHDFGYRGCSSEETAAISGASHLLNFHGSDTVPAMKFIDQYYAPTDSAPTGLSVPATEHSVMCSYGQENEIEAFRHMLRTYPTGIVSIVSDTYDLWNVLTNFTDILRDEILNRDGKVVFRPDSGDPVKIICGDFTPTLRIPDASSPWEKGALEILWEKFGGTVNSKGYRVLNPKVGLIYGDGMYYDRFGEMLKTMKSNGFASSNLVIGVGGILLQSHNRDEFGFSLKATRICRGDNRHTIFKDPVTDPGKKSKRGLMKLDYSFEQMRYVTLDRVSEQEEKEGLLVPVFRDGELLVHQPFNEIKARLHPKPVLV